MNIRLSSVATCAFEVQAEPTNQQVLLRAYPRAAIVDDYDEMEEEDWPKVLEVVDPFTCHNFEEHKSRNLVDAELSRFADGIIFHPYQVHSRDHMTSEHNGASHSLSFACVHATCVRLLRSCLNARTF